jgi:hypothetical protein
MVNIVISFIQIRIGQWIVMWPFQCLYWLSFKVTKSLITVTGLACKMHSYDLVINDTPGNPKYYALFTL